MDDSLLDLEASGFEAYMNQVNFVTGGETFSLFRQQVGDV